MVIFAGGLVCVFFSQTIGMDINYADLPHLFINKFYFFLPYTQDTVNQLLYGCKKYLQGF